MNATKIALVIVIIIALGVGAYILIRPQETDTTNNQTQRENNTNQETMQEDSTVNEEPLTEAEDEMAEGRVIELTGTNYQFSEEIVEVEAGERVTIEFTSNEGMHDWVVDEFNASTEVVNVGEVTRVTFTPDEAGEYEFYCSVGNHRELGMVGTLVVTE